MIFNLFRLFYGIYMKNTYRNVFILMLLIKFIK